MAVIRSSTTLDWRNQFFFQFANFIYEFFMLYQFTTPIVTIFSMSSYFSYQCKPQLLLIVNLFENIMNLRCIDALKNLELNQNLLDLS